MRADKPGFIRRSFRFIWNLITWLRVGLANLFFIALILLIIFAFIPKDVTSMPEKTALRLAPSGMLVDQRSYIDPLTHVLGQSNSEDGETLVRDLVLALQRAATDERITAVVLDLSYLLGGGISKLEEIGAAISEFKVSGKPVIAVSDSYTQDQYYLASFADEIYLNPMGSVLLTGYGSYRNYFRGAIDALKLNFHVFRVGEYKDAVEPFLQNSMSEASREHNQLWLNDLWEAYQDRVESQRQLAAGSLNDYINNLDKHLAKHKGDSASLALAMGLVDHIATPPQITEALQQKMGKSINERTYQYIDTPAYLHFTREAVLPGSKKIGLLVARGTIVDGEAPAGSIGGDTLSELIRDVREDDELDALVLRIDSGGGSAFASEQIREELEATRNAGIPVIISMGSVAASGGYWVAMGGDEVWATPTTITGSIGVFSAFPTLENTLEALGIHTDGVGTTKLAGALRVDRPLSPEAKGILQQTVNHIYQQFLTLVANARHSTPEHIHTVAQGHVWTGSAAQELGLVDELGSLEDAIAAAAKRIEAKDYQVVPVEEQPTPFQQLIAEITQNTAQTFSSHIHIPAVWQQLMAPFTSMSAMVSEMNDPRGIYARCLECGK